jgi:hypothetical protein
MSKVLIIGGGAAGMLAAILAAEQGNEVHVFEKNEKLGKKLFITGKGRCNVTNACDTEELFSAVMSNPKFLYSAFYSFTSQDMMEFLEASGVPLKVERGNRVFPQSDHSSDVIRALERRMKKAGVSVHLNTEVRSVTAQDGAATGIILSDGKSVRADQVIVATGGMSYQTTGSTGDGYRFARELGHKVTELSPSLVPLYTKESYIPKLTGLSLKNAALMIKNGKKVLYEDFGEMLFTHTGVSGPMILSASAHLGAKWNGTELSAFVDLKPALSAEQLDARILREFDAARNKQLKNVIGALYLSGIDPEKPVHDISREERRTLVELTKAFPFTIVGRGEFAQAIITKGGVSVKEISPNTMESKKVSGLYFIGEVLDLDAVTGGYNLQIAWSTAYLAAKALNKE